MILKDYVSDKKILDNIVGTNDKNLLIICRTFDIGLKVVNTDVVIECSDPMILKLVTTFFDFVLKLTNLGIELGERDLVYL
jgi:hypothetical protein